MSSPIVAAQETSKITPCQTFEGHAEWIGDIVHLPGGEQIMTCSWDGSLRVWNIKSGKQVGDKWQDGESPVRTIALSPDGKKVVSGSRDGGVRLWDIDTGKVVARWMGHTEEVKSVCWSQNGQRVLSGSYDGTAREWDVENGETTLGPIDIGYQFVCAAVYSPDKTMFATAGSGRCMPGVPDLECPIKIWDVKTGELVAALNGHTMFCLAWTMDGKTLISGSFHSDHSIRTWNTKTWKHVAVLEGHTDEVYSIVISPNGCVLASASRDKTARLWNIENGQPISSPLHHEDMVISVIFSADGKQLATACHDNNAYLWDVSAILHEVGLEDLLLDKQDERDKSMTINVMRRPVQPIRVLNRVPQRFFDGSPLPNRAHRSARDPNDTPHRLFQWARDIFSGTPSSAQIEPHGDCSALVDVPYAKGKRRNASARERRRPTLTHATQQPRSASTAQAQSQAAASTSTAPPVVAHTAPSTHPHVIIKHPGRWTRFWLFICCTSSEYTDGQH